MIDANASLPKGDGRLTHDYGAETATRTTQVFLDFLQAHQLSVPSTFAHLHEGQSTKWTHSTGKKSRKDYILVPYHMLNLVQASWVDVNHDNTFSHEDHLPVTRTCKGWCPLIHSDNKILRDEKALLCPERVAQFQAALTTLSLPTWHVSIDDHTALFEEPLLTLAQHFFAKPRPKHARSSCLGRLSKLSPSSDMCSTLVDAQERFLMLPFEPT